MRDLTIEDFYIFLKDKGIFKEWLYGVRGSFDNVEGVKNYLDYKAASKSGFKRLVGCFDWYSSNRGQNFWDAIDTEWREFVSDYIRRQQGERLQYHYNLFTEANPEPTRTRVRTYQVPDYRTTYRPTMIISDEEPI